MAELRTQDTTELTDELAKHKEELFNLRFQSATGQLENSARLKTVKREIARIYTILRERELGIGEAAPAVKAKGDDAAAVTGADEAKTVKKSLFSKKSKSTEDSVDTDDAVATPKDDTTTVEDEK